MPEISLELDEDLGYRRAMRQLAGGVSVVTVGRAPHRTGFTATSVSSLSVDPPRLIVSVNRGSSSFPATKRSQCFGVSILARHHHDIAMRFGGAAGAKGEERFGTDCWHTMKTGASLLCDGLAAFDCELEEIIERHSHGILVGRIVATRHRNIGDALVYWRSDYHGVDDPALDRERDHWAPVLAARNIGGG